MESSNVINIEANIDIEKTKELIEKAKDLNDNEEFFQQLAEFTKVKKQVGDILDQISDIETDVKGFIKSKADALYGNKWETIKGHNYKISKSATGSVFDISGKPNSKFIKVKKSVDTKAVETFVKEKGKLPAGIDYSPSRGTSIRITVHENEDDKA